MGNKVDLVQERLVTLAEAKEVAARLKIDHFVTSAAENQNIDHVFCTLAQALWVDWETSSGRVQRLHTSRVSQVIFVTVGVLHAM